MILEISKKYVDSFYDGNIKKAVANKDGVIISNNKRYINDNKKYCIYYDLNTHAFI